MPPKKICAITMARNDEFFLSRWIDYYGRELGHDHLYVYLDGVDQPIPANAGKANVIHQERVIEHVVAAEKRRLGFLSDVAEKLLETYDIVIGVDADEFLVVDPKAGLSLTQYLSSIKINPCVSGLGMDVGQHLTQEPTLDYGQPFLAQRKYAYLSSRYTKPSVISRPVRWGSGFHRVKGHNFIIDPNLYLFHFGSVDMEMINMRFRDNDRMSTGREGHIRKRVRTIDLTTTKKPFKNEVWLRLGRTIQTFARPLYAINKPSMAGLKIVVEIPERFRNVL